MTAHPELPRLLERARVQQAAAESARYAELGRSIAASAAEAREAHDAQDAYRPLSRDQLFQRLGSALEAPRQQALRSRALDTIMDRLDARLGTPFYEAFNRARPAGSPEMTRQFLRAAFEQLPDAKLAALLREFTPAAAAPTADPRLDAGLRHIATGQQYQRADLSSKPLHKMSSAELRAMAASRDNRVSHSVPMGLGDTWDSSHAHVPPATSAAAPWR
jgi:hypothetical protein